MRWSRLATGVACATVALVTLAGSALAGGWAVTTIDALPEGGFQAGQPYRLGYTIRQHGQTPFDGAKTSLTITSGTTREQHHFRGVPDGQPGHYVAEVTFPSEGAWDWEVSQHPFAVQTLGTVTVGPAAASVPGAKESMVAPATTSPLFSVAVPVALVLAALIGWPLVGLVRRRRGTPEPRLARAAE